MAWVANILYLAAAVAYMPVLLYQMIRQGKNRSGWGEKLFGPRRLRMDSGSRKRIWVHAVSLGEINAARGIVEGLRTRYADYEVVVSTTTDTGYARAVQLYGADSVFRYPLDFSWSVKAALDAIRPSMIVLVELEVWFNLVTIATARGVPVCVVNGRLTERSCRRLSKLGALSRRMFGCLSWVGAQDDVTAVRFGSLGVGLQRLAITGSVKWDTAVVADRMEGQEELALALGIDGSRKLWVCGSTGPGEESILLEVFRRLRRSDPELQLALVPRKPERFDQVAQLVEQSGFACVRRSRRADGCAEGAVAAESVLLGDTMGESRKFYGLADVVFVGRSLVPMGGSDPMEVAALGKPVVVGQFMDNFALPTEVLKVGGGLRQVRDADELVEVVGELVHDGASAVEMGRKGQKVVVGQKGATERTLESLEQALLDCSV